MKKTRVLYNGDCAICSREVGIYARVAKTHDLDMQFEALGEADTSAWGVTKDQAARAFHVLRDGQVTSGVDAFVLLWRDMPRFRWLGWLVSRPLILPVARWVYDRLLARALYGLHKRRIARANPAIAPARKPK